METTQKIVFRQTRDFSGVLNATFAFVRQNYKTLGKIVFFLTGPFILLASIFGSLYNADTVSLQPGALGLAFFSNLFILMVTFLVGYAVLNGAVCSYIILYMNKEPQEIDIDAIWQATRRNLGKILLAALSGAFLTGLGMIMCLLPGIYLFVPFSFLMIVTLLEKKSLGEALPRCFKLISEQWWPTFGLLIVVSLIAFALGFVFNIPNYILSFWSAFHLHEQGAAPENFRLLSIVASTLSYVAGFFFHVVPLVAICLQYFNLVEQKEAAGLFEKIGKIGEGHAPAA